MKRKKAEKRIRIKNRERKTVLKKRMDRNYKKEKKEEKDKIE